MTVFVHVGAPKTGTTYLQQLMAANRTALAAAGVSYPGSTADHFRPALGVIGESFGLADVGPEAWRRLARQARSHQGHTVISHEGLGRADRTQAREALAAFGPDADLRVIYTVRSLDRTLPAMWQETLKNRESATFEEYLARIRRQVRTADADAPWPRPLRGFDLEGTLGRWTDDLDPSRVSVVVVPRSGPPDELWTRFAGVIGVDPGSCTPPARSNESLGLAEAEVLRRLNSQTTEAGIAWRDFHAIVKHDLPPRLLAMTHEHSRRITLPPDHHGWVAAWSQQRVDFLRDSGFRVVGDLADLHPDPPVDQDPASPEETLEVALELSTLLLGDVARLRRRGQATVATRRRVRDLPRRAARRIRRRR